MPSCTAAGPGADRLDPVLPELRRACAAAAGRLVRSGPDVNLLRSGSAAAIEVRAEDAHRYADAPLYVKALAQQDLAAQSQPSRGGR